MGWLGHETLRRRRRKTIWQSKPMSAAAKVSKGRVPPAHPTARPWPWLPVSPTLPAPPSQPLSPSPTSLRPNNVVVFCVLIYQANQIANGTLPLLMSVQSVHCEPLTSSKIKNALWTSILWMFLHHLMTCLNQTEYEMMRQIGILTSFCELLLCQNISSNLNYLHFVITCSIMSIWS